VRIGGNRLKYKHGDKPEIFGLVILLGILVVESNFLQSIAAKIVPDSSRPAIRAA